MATATHTHTHTYTRTRTRTHNHTYTHANAILLNTFSQLSPLKSRSLHAWFKVYRQEAVDVDRIENAAKKRAVASVIVASMLARYHSTILPRKLPSYHGVVERIACFLFFRYHVSLPLLATKSSYHVSPTTSCYNVSPPLSLPRFAATANSHCRFVHKRIILILVLHRRYHQQRCLKPRCRTTRCASRSQHLMCQQQQHHVYTSGTIYTAHQQLCSGFQRFGFYWFEIVR